MTDYTSWHVGMEVVFVGYAPDVTCYADDPDLKSGQIYKLLAISVMRAGSLCIAGGNVKMLKSDLVYVQVLPDANIWTIAEAFRPVVKRKTDISVFHELRRGIERQMDKLKEFERTHPL